ncbi:MAG: sigma-70 family RNA polymerase sigma factor [Tannerella sp.]|jgi:RNA polymerase sigma-70 factor (ECF subfamily)|nr:sigma-70 family RNA polymerase sigma factor [Tannerella sp.]
MKNIHPDHLLDHIIKGDENALRMLFESYSHKLFHRAFHYLQIRELAEEAVLDVFTNIWKKRKTLAHVKNIELYLYTSVKNQALHYIRRNYTPLDERLSLYETELIPDYHNPESIMLDEEYEILIQKAVDSLPPKCKEVFRLVLSDKLKIKQIASLLSISESAVNQHISLAYKRIAEFVKKQYR